jgi:hypothetical protein
VRKLSLSLLRLTTMLLVIVEAKITVVMLAPKWEYLAAVVPN